MFEVENVQSNGDVSPESSSSTPNESTADSNSSAPEQSTASGANPDSSSNVPFHEHPRWKEVMAERDQFKTELTRIREEMSRSRQPAPEAAEDPKARILERLKGIDPEFAGLMTELVTKLSKVEQVEQGWKSFETNHTQQTAAQQMQSLHDQYKVPKDYQDLYRDHVRAVAADNPQMTLRDLPAVYKQVHDRFSRLLEGVKRSERESYVKSKTADSAVPGAQPKSTAAKPMASKPKFSDNRDVARKELIQSVLQSVRTNKDSA